MESVESDSDRAEVQTQQQLLLLGSSKGFDGDHGVQGRHGVLGKVVLASSGGDAPELAAAEEEDPRPQGAAFERFCTAVFLLRSHATTMRSNGRGMGDDESGSEGLRGGGGVMWGGGRERERCEEEEGGPATFISLGF